MWVRPEGTGTINRKRVVIAAVPHPTPVSLTGMCVHSRCRAPPRPSYWEFLRLEVGGGMLVLKKVASRRLGDGRWTLKNGGRCSHKQAGGGRLRTLPYPRRGVSRNRQVT